MGVVTLEGIIEGGQVRITSDVRLPDKIKVYVVIPGIQIERVAHVFTPRLAHPEQAVDFELEIVEEPSHACL
jgi:hypothetical protein